MGTTPTTIPAQAVWILPKEGVMKVYEIREERVHRGAQVYSRSPQEALILGGGSNNKKVPLFRKNPAEILHNRILEAHPVSIHDGYALAKPNQESDKILVVVSARAYYSLEGCDRRTGIWNFYCGTLPLCGGGGQGVLGPPPPPGGVLRL